MLFPPFCPGEKKIKTRLCEKFLQYGVCAFGDHCTYAHGVRELQKAVSSLGPSASNNPSFKTSLCRHVASCALVLIAYYTTYMPYLCRAYMSGMYCQFADKCQYAHGRHELREKQSLKPGDLDEEGKQQYIEK